MYICVYVYMYICVYVYIYEYICMYVYMYCQVRLTSEQKANMHACICVFMYICVYLYMYIFIYVHIFSNIYMHVYIATWDWPVSKRQRCMYEFEYTCIYVYLYIYIYVCIYAYIQYMYIPPDPINDLCSLTGKSISEKCFTYRSVQIFQILFGRFYSSESDPPQGHVVLVLLLNLVGFFISTRPKWSGGNVVYHWGTSSEGASRGDQP